MLTAISRIFPSYWVNATTHSQFGSHRHLYVLVLPRYLYSVTVVRLHMNIKLRYICTRIHRLPVYFAQYTHRTVSDQEMSSTLYEKYRGQVYPV